MRPARRSVSSQTSPAHSYNLGKALKFQGKLEEAVIAYREAIRLKPDFAEAYCDLGGVLRVQESYTESLAMVRRGHALGRSAPDWRYPSARWLAEAERLAALAARLPPLINGDDHPRDTAERLAVARMCYDTKRFAAAARFWGDAFTSEPKLADDLKAGHRYNAACAAALAGCGQGRNDQVPDASARAKLRKQALEWLKAELAFRAKQFDVGRPLRGRSCDGP